MQSLSSSCSTEESRVQLTQLIGEREEKDETNVFNETEMIRA